MRCFSILTLMVTCLLTGCDHAGGSIGNLVPAPKFLKGTIKDGVYSAPDNFFSISVPQQEGSNEYRYMQIKERFSDAEVYLSFGPAAIDQSIFRLDIAKRVTAGSHWACLGKVETNLSGFDVV
jgi:hypothetical protein